MTDHKHLKARVRTRMAKTGERYAAARAHVVAAREATAAGEAAPDRPFHLTGPDPETTALRILLASARATGENGAALSDPTALVIGGGIGIGVFAFHYEREGFSSFFLAGRHRWDDAAAYLGGGAERLGFRLETSEATSPAAGERRLREALEHGPAVVWVDSVTLGTRGSPMAMAGGGYHTLIVHRIDDAAGSAIVSDLTPAAIPLPFDVLARARARIAKHRHRVGRLVRGEGDSAGRPIGDLASAMRAGLAATVAGFDDPRTRNFSLGALTDWSDRLRGRPAASSWARTFPPGEWRWVGLAAIHEGIEHHGSGGGLGRGRFAAGLREAAAVLGRDGLLAVAERYDELARAWSEVATAALPGDVPLLRRTREAQDRRAAAYAAGGIGPDGSPAAAVTDAWRDLDACRAEAAEAFPMTDPEAVDHLAALADRVAAVHAAEVAALAALRSVV